MKLCPKCDIEQPLDAFHRDRSKAGGVASNCRACCLEVKRRYYEANRDRLLEKQRRYRKEHPEQTHAATMRWKAEHPERVRAYGLKWRRLNPEHGVSYSRRWRAANPERARENALRHCAARRARRLSAAVVEPIDRMAIYERDRGCCHFCGRKVSRATFQLDHLVPLSWPGAEHSARNLAVAHPSCNNRSGAGRLPAQLRMVG